MQNFSGLDTVDVSVTLPSDLENLKLPDPSLTLYYKNLDNRILWMDAEINESSIEFAKQIMQWNYEDKNIPVEKRKPITILFFSPGGDLDVNNLLVDTIQLSKTKVVGINCGMAASAGCFIYLACHERLTFPKAKFLIHQGAGEFSGTYEIVCAAIANYQNEINKLGEYVLKRTSIPEDVFYANFSSDWYIDADEAVKYGIAHRIVSDLDCILAPEDVSDGG